MTQSDSKTTASPDKPITRRRIVHGAAWTVPVIAASVAAPAMAASPTCPEGTPDLGAQSGWTATIVTPEQFSPRTDNGNGWFANEPRSYFWNGDHAVAGTQAPSGIMTLTKQIPVVAGTTYVFTYGVAVSAGGTNWQEVSLGATFGDQQVLDWSNSGNVPRNARPPAYATRTLTYTAATTGTMPFTFTFTAPARVRWSPANEDFIVLFPEDATTCTP
jgi:hypothetical protein